MGVAREAIDREGFTSARDLDIRIQMVHPALSPATWSVNIRADFGRRSVKVEDQ